MVIVFRKFIDEVVAIINEQYSDNNSINENVYEYIADLIFQLILTSAKVRSPRSISRKIQHELVWDSVFNSPSLNYEAGIKIKDIVQQKIYLKVARIQFNPDLDSVELLGFCLNVMGFRVATDEHFGISWRKLHKQIIIWSQCYLATILNRYPLIVSHGFVDGMTFDSDNSRLVITYESSSSNRNYYFEYLKLFKGMRLKT